ncbi:MAG: PLP-dependent aminotransferase family protein [Alphaproteobacteria bacterium]|nr:PLP-dependent aminotransferase family protein [Alphaproteobacteria bacterium]
MQTSRPRTALPATLWTTRLERGAGAPLSRQLAAALRTALSERQIDAGARLPSTRALARELGLARSTVVGVYEQLAAEGYIAGKPGSGYLAAASLAERGPMRPPEATAAPRPLSRRAERLRGYVPEARGSPRPFQMGYAEIDPRFVATWKRLAGRVLSGRSRIEWNYGDPQGDPGLRGAVADYLAVARGVRCRPEQIVLTSGTQQGLSLTAQVLLDPGSTTWVEDPCYHAAVDILRAAEARIVPVPVDDDGLDLAAGLRGVADVPRLVYVTPSRQYPLGMAMPLARRAALLDWAARDDVWLVEDDYESEFQAPGRMLPSLQGLDRAGRVIYLGTFSKLLFPSLRLGYAVLPPDLVVPFAAARHLADRQSSALIQAIMLEFMLDGHFARHLKRMRARYAERERFLVERVRRKLDGVLEIRPVDSGMYLTAWLPPGWSDSAAAMALAEAGVAALPLSALTLETSRRPGLVLGYTGHNEAATARAVDIMTDVLHRPTGLFTLSKADLRADRLRA